MHESAATQHDSEAQPKLTLRRRAKGLMSPFCSCSGGSARDGRPSTPSGIASLQKAVNQFAVTADKCDEVPDLQGKSYADFKLSKIDWVKIRKMHEVLREPAKIQQYFSSARFPTALEEARKRMVDFLDAFDGELDDVDTEA
ncbi:hypothetical protein C8R47DRAFT_1322644 [Mycena vitilis]|nr:hypothetical protein C8R47DRAFT_1322644 [Mycena vitilis]